MDRMRESLRAFRDVFRNAGLRRLQLAWAGSILGTWAYAIAVVVYAYEHGGATAVGLVGLIRWTAGGLASPFAAVLGDRYDRRAVMVGSDLARVVLIGGIRPQPQERRAPEPIREELLAGARTIARDRRLRLLVGLFSAQTFVDGMLNVLIVVVALKLLDSGRAGVGFLNSAIGVGG